MKDSILSAQVFEPYAQALMSLAQSSDLVDRFGDDVAYLLEVIKSSSELKQFLGNPLTSPDAKKNVLRQLIAEQVHPYTLNFVLLLVDRKRITFLEGICKQYQLLLRQLRQTVLAEVTSAVELTDAQKDSIRQKVMAMVNARQVDLETSIDPDLIGGVIIKVGSQIVDASLRGQIRRIGFRLASAN